MCKFKVIFTILVVFVNFPVLSQTNQYQYEIDLLNVKDDKVSVSLSPPKNNIREGKFVMPKLVPGYYDAIDLGQFVSDFQAFNKKGEKIAVKKMDKNTWIVNDLRNTARITYQVADGWDYLTQNTGGAKSCESMFRKDSVFVINYSSLIGYFEEIKNTAYQITVRKNQEFYSSSALKYIHENDTTDVVTAKDYRHLVDSPVMYCAPDTTWLTVGNARILVSFYSKEHRGVSKALATKLETILDKQQEYLGGKLPVDEYAFLIYQEEVPRGLMGDGLEHSQSTVCLYASNGMDKLSDALIGVASHEFFHVLTPLNVHSEEIQDFNFLNPVLSRHLWLYEGMTEYATIHMPVKQRMITVPDFLLQIEEKIKGMEKFDNSLSMTEMSINSIQKQDQYMNFYQKGALVGLCLDIRLRELSGGKVGTQDLVQSLMEKYGAEKAFKDADLFDVIASMTFPEIRPFFKDYVEGGHSLPLKESLLKVGFDYDESAKSVKEIAHPSASQLALRKAWINQ